MGLMSQPTMYGKRTSHKLPNPLILLCLIMFCMSYVPPFTLTLANTCTLALTLGAIITAHLPNAWETHVLKNLLSFRFPTPLIYSILHLLYLTNHPFSSSCI